MKKTIIFLIVLILLAPLAVGCKNSEVEELKEQVAELSEKLAEEKSITTLETEESNIKEVNIPIAWNNAKYHIGETITVYGPVVTTYYGEDKNEKTTFFNIGKDYPDPDGFSVWIKSINREKFSQTPEVYYLGKNIYVTGLIVEVDGLPHMEITDPSQISIGKKIADEESNKDTAEESVVVSTTEKETLDETAAATSKETEPAKEESLAPTINLEIIEGPAFSQLGDNACYYRVKANVTGSPSPSISFNKDDSLGSLGKNIAQVNLYNKGESFTLEATATNSAGSSSATITLTHTCQDHIPIIIQNNTGGNVSINLSGPGSYSFNVAPGQKIIYVIPGTYNYKGIGCGGSTLSGTEDLSSPNHEWKWWCE